MIIGISGKARSGKNTAADFFHKKYGTVDKSFASKVKEFASNIYSSAVFEDADVAVQCSTILRKSKTASRVSVIPENDNFAVKYSFWNGQEDSKRIPLVEVGHKGRLILGEDVWVNALFNSLNFNDTILNTGITVSDVRYLNEAKALESLSEKLKVPFHLIYIESDVEYKGAEEESLPPVKEYADFIITNNYKEGSTTLEEFINSLDSIELVTTIKK